MLQEFRKLHNFTGVMEIISGLGNSSVKRLSKTWEGVEASLMETYRILSREMSFEKNFKIYRELLKTVGTPCLPYFGVRSSLSKLLFFITKTCILLTYSACRCTSQI